MPGSSQRNRSYRQRRRHGRMIFRVEGDAYIVPNTLIELDLLTEAGAADIHAVNIVLGRFLEAALRSARLKYSATRRVDSGPAAATGGDQQGDHAHGKRAAAGG